MSDKLKFGTANLDPLIEMFSKEITPMYFKLLDGADVKQYPALVVPTYTARLTPSILGGYGCKGLPKSSNTTDNPFGRTLLGIRKDENEVIQSRTIQTGNEAGDGELLQYDPEVVLHRVDVQLTVYGQGELPDAAVITLPNLSASTVDFTAQDTGKLLGSMVINALIRDTSFIDPENEQLGIKDKTSITIPVGADWEISESAELRDLNQWSIKFRWTLTLATEGLAVDAPIVVVDANKTDSLLSPNPRDVAVDSTNIWKPFMVSINAIWNQATTVPYTNARYAISRSRVYYPNDLMDEILRVSVLRCPYS